MKFLCGGLVFTALAACQAPVIQADYLIENGQVFAGDNTPAEAFIVAIKDDKIIYVGAPRKVETAAVIDAQGHYVLPGFIDPHTHSIADLLSADSTRRQNQNYQFQGVTTVFNGNDGFGDPDIEAQAAAALDGGIGTNTAFFVGHGALRKSVMGGDGRAPTDAELTEMQSRVAQGMTDGALGLSSGLFYAPGSFSDTEEVIELAKVAAAFGGVYDSHIRDESTYNVGLLASIDEVIEIGTKANIPVNIAHIKALGVDVWGESAAIIQKVEAAQQEGINVTADQYPWRASGTRISNALIPRWVKAGTVEDYLARLSDPEQIDVIRAETAENLRKRGGAEAVLVTRGKPEWQNKTLGAIASERGENPVETALYIARNGDASIASFNMDAGDILNFMSQDWVMTSSDGSTGHPRKYASYPKKYRDYVIAQNVMPVETFFYRSSGMVADTFGLCERGYLKPGYKADIAIISPDDFAPAADFQNPALLSKGVTHLFVNGKPVIENSKANADLPGDVVRRCRGAVGE